jgi:hypothetical protein
MSRLTNKIILVTVWIFVVFGYLYLMQFAYEKKKSFHLFVFMVIVGSMAYDGLKVVIRYNPLYPSDAATVTKYVLGFVACLVSSLASLFIGAALFHRHIVSEFFGQMVAAIGFLASMVFGMVLLGKAEAQFNLSTRAVIKKIP